MNEADGDYRRLPMFSPQIFKIYTNDQQDNDGTISFTYADDLYITAQFPTFSQIAPIAQLLSALDFNFVRAVERSIITAGKMLSLKI